MNKPTASLTWEEHETPAEAKLARDAEYQALKASGIPCRRTSLHNKIKLFDGRGDEIYVLHIDGPPHPRGPLTVTIA